MSGLIQSAGQASSNNACPAEFHWRGPLAIASLSILAICATIDPTGVYPELGPGPGLTLDEVFNVETGVYQWRALREHGVNLWTDPVREQILGEQSVYNPDHPPLGRLWIGAVHDAAIRVLPPLDVPAATVIACGRFASALAFGLTVLIVGLFAGRMYGRAASWLAPAALCLMPRMFAHAHLAALETCMGLAFSSTVLFVAWRWTRAERGPTWLSAVLAGILFGAALLTKIQAILLPLPVVLWALWHWRWRAVPLLLVSGVVAGAVFLLCWPWLWIDPLSHVREYFARTTDRPVVYCKYLGERYADTDVPWHYPFVMTAVTTPLTWLLLCAIGAAHWRRAWWKARREDGSGSNNSTTPTALIVMTIGFVLVFFALPGVPVYDGVRLFLVVFPLGAVLVGAGAEACWRFLVERRRRWLAVLLLAVACLIPMWSIATMHPLHLSYYNLAVGGLRGADRLGMERTYWRDSFTRSFAREIAESVPAGATIDVAPVLHDIYLVDGLYQTPVLLDREITFRAYRDDNLDQIEYVIVFRRGADPWASLEPAPAGGELLAEVRRQGVQLAALYRLTKDVPSR